MGVVVKAIAGTTNFLSMRVKDLEALSASKGCRTKGS